jgi:hypothetical protein
MKCQRNSCLREGVRVKCFFLYALRERQGRMETVEANTARG